MLRTIGLFIKGIARLFVGSTLMLPSVLYQRKKATRIFANQLRKQGIPEKAVQELTECYKSAVSPRSIKISQ